MRPKEYILLAASVLMICMLIIPKIIKYERAHNVHGHFRPWVDITGGVKSALGCYLVDLGHYPTNLEDMVERTADATNWHGPYFDPPKVPLDP